MDEVRSLFENGMDTYDIAKRFGIPESRVVVLLVLSGKAPFPEMVYPAVTARYGENIAELAERVQRARRTGIWRSRVSK